METTSLKCQVSVSSPPLLVSVTYIGIGAVFGLAYLTDAWRPLADPKDIGLRKSPKIRGILYILGGAAIPLFSKIISFFEKQTSIYVLQCYFLGVVGTIIVGLTLLWIQTLFISYQKVNNFSPDNGFWLNFADAYTYAMVAIQDGPKKFLEDIESREIILIKKKHAHEATLLRDKISKTRKQADETFKFFGGYFAALVANVDNSKTGAQNFVDFINPLIEKFSRRLLIPEENFRVAIYFLNPEDNKFYYLVSPDEVFEKHSRKPLIFEGSLAGHAIGDPDYPHVYVEDDDLPNKNTNPPFLKHRKHHYKSTIVYCVRPLRSERKNLPKLVLCIDCQDNVYRSGTVGYLRRITTYLGISVADACLALKVNEDEINDWLKLQYWYNFPPNSIEQNKGDTDKEQRRFSRSQE